MKLMFSVFISISLSACGLLNTQPTISPWIGHNINELDARPDFATDKLEIRKLDDGTEVRHYKNVVGVIGNQWGFSESACSRVVYVKDKIITNYVFNGNCGNRTPASNQ